MANTVFRYKKGCENRRRNFAKRIKLSSAAAAGRGGDGERAGIEWNRGLSLNRLKRGLSGRQRDRETTTAIMISQSRSSPRIDKGCALVLCRFQKFRNHEF